MKHIISFSGGLGSFAVACLVKEKFPLDHIELVFTDTHFEDEDLYRFIKEASDKLGLPLIILSNKDNDTPLTLMEKDNFMYNSRVAKCSYKLKSKVFREYLKTQQKDCILYFGIGFEESHRVSAITNAYKNHQVMFPLCDEIVDVEEYLKKYNIKKPRLYDMGFAHNNCGGRCVKGGIGHWVNLLRKDYTRFIEMRDFEKKFSVKLNIKHDTSKTYSFIKRNGKPYTLEKLEEDYRKQGEQLEIDFDDIGGCGCFVDYK